MKKTIYLFLLLLGNLLAADAIDIHSSEGTDQSIIASLTPAPASPEVDANTSIEAVFADALNPASTLHSITLKRLTGKKKRWGFFGFGVSKANDEIIKGSTEYDPDTYTLRFTPKHPLRVGFYEVKINHLMRMRPGPEMMVKDIRYRFYVPEVINGFKLPPVPDPKKNDETLLGVDFNRNGIRDDVERWIIHRYANDPKYPKTKTAIALQYAWASQKILENPTMESKKYLDDAIDCQYYWFHSKQKTLTDQMISIADTNQSKFWELFSKRSKWEKENRIFNDPELKDHFFNTEERIKQKFRFNEALSGHIFEGRDESIRNCKYDIDAYGE